MGGSKSGAIASEGEDVYRPNGASLAVPNLNNYAIRDSSLSKSSAVLRKKESYIASYASRVIVVGSGGSS